ncbi:hypothetical protein M885DRAFT_535629, partial [Pelagophyceae sp. CCMP2097]
MLSWSYSSFLPGVRGGDVGTSSYHVSVASIPPIPAINFVGSALPAPNSFETEIPPPATRDAGAVSARSGGFHLHASGSDIDEGRGPRRDRRRLRKRHGLPPRDGAPRLWRHWRHREGRHAVQPRRRRPGGPRQNDRDVQAACRAPPRRVGPRRRTARCRGTKRRGPASRG